MISLPIILNNFNNFNNFNQSNTILFYLNYLLNLNIITICFGYYGQSLNVFTKLKYFKKYINEK